MEPGPGKTFIVHYDEESVFTPAELRKLIKVLASTTCSVLEGPIYYPLEYSQASVLCRTMEANRPAGCFECRHVMESGVPLHLHGSNLVVDEHFENTLGWDIGCLDGQPFISEDYVFGMKAYLAGGTSVFGWHGCVMLEQPPFSVRSAFRQRYRWIFGVLQGITMARRTAAFKALPLRQRLKLTVGTAYRIATFALGSIVGTLSFAYLPVLVVRSINAVSGRHTFYLPPALTLWLAIVGFLWVGSVFIGAWYNTTDAGLPRLNAAARSPSPSSSYLSPAYSRARPGFGPLPSGSGGRGKSCGFPRPRPKRLTPLSVVGLRRRNGRSAARLVPVPASSPSSPMSAGPRRGPGHDAGPRCSRKR